MTQKRLGEAANTKALEITESTAICDCGTFEDAFKSVLRDMADRLDKDCSKWVFVTAYMQNYMSVMALDTVLLRAGFTREHVNAEVASFQSSLDNFLEPRIEEIIRYFIEDSKKRMGDREV